MSALPVAGYLTELWELSRGDRFVTTATGRRGRITWTAGARGNQVEVVFDGSPEPSYVRSSLLVVTEVEAATPPN